MPYPKDLLSDDERVILDLRPHWISVIPALLWAAGIAGLAAASLMMGGIAIPPLAIAIVVIALIAIFLLAGIPLLRWHHTQFVLTSERLITREGVLARKAREIPLNRINDVTFTQSFLERLVGSGNLTIESAGEQGINRLVFIRQPEQVQHEIYKAMEHVEKSAGTGEAPEDIPTQIEKLAALRDKGIVTPEEFEKKKKELLERM
ncbi:MAG: PH domain-containing protein [Candidatus Eremiobacteraeota bacterium]|nr:PH domain-containing protein [Candidatus Eremiobacteraeota bacterium]